MIQSCFSLDPLNGMHIPEFNDPQKQSEDIALLAILTKLDILSDWKDVRTRL